MESNTQWNGIFYKWYLHTFGTMYFDSNYATNVEYQKSSEPGYFHYHLDNQMFVISCEKVYITAIYVIG